MNPFTSLTQTDYGSMLTQRNDPTGAKVAAVVILYGSAWGFSERTTQSPCGCVASTEDYFFFWETQRRKRGP